MKLQSALRESKEETYEIPFGQGYWNLDNYPIGGKFGRAPRSGKKLEFKSNGETVTYNGQKYLIGVLSSGEKAAFGYHDIVRDDDW